MAVIATRHAGIPEQIEHERTGLLVDERDVGAMAAQLVLLDRHRALGHCLGSAAAEKVAAEHSLAAHAAQLGRVYRELA
jgi:glycosyltransferase involved in cell wall biosynthesis